VRRGPGLGKITQTSNVPRGMWVVAAALSPQELPPKVRIHLALIVGPVDRLRTALG